MPRFQVTVVSLAFCLALILALPLAVSWGETGGSPQSPAPAGLQTLAGLPATQGSDALQPVASTQVANTPWVTVTLPLILNGYFSRLSCPADSPFGIEIAALDKILPATNAVRSPSAVQEAAWLARVEAGFGTLVDALEASGACWTRLQIKWSTIQPDPPPAPYVWKPEDEYNLALVAESGVQTIAIIHDVPDWAQDNGEQRIAADRLDEFAAFLTDLVNRYKQPPYNIHHWELFNEPDGVESLEGIGGWGDHGDQYAAMLSWAYPVIKAADPTATVLMGGIAYDNFEEYEGPFNRYFTDDIMDAGAASHLDVVNFHYFPDFFAEWERWVPEGNPPTCGNVEDQQGTPYEAWGIDIVAKTNHFRNRLSTCSGVDKPVWLTELGEHGNADQPEMLAQQARYVIQGHARALAAGVERVIWFALVSPNYDPYEQGLLYESDWSPKPAFYTYRTLVQEMAGYEHLYDLDVEGVEGYVFGNGAQEQKTVAWAWGPAGQPGYLTFPNANRLRLVNRQGQISFVQDGGPGDVDGVQNGSVRIQLPAPPIDDQPAPPRLTAEPYFISRSN